MEMLKRLVKRIVHNWIRMYVRVTILLRIVRCMVYWIKYTIAIVLFLHPDRACMHHYFNIFKLLLSSGPNKC